ncbi:MAG: FtsW/RodA/SpoVE family cell cycle protein [Huintestinicola sp.]
MIIYERREEMSRNPNPASRSGKAANAPKKQKRLQNNKTWFKFLMPKSAYLENIKIGGIDLPFLLLIMVLLVFGLVMMYSASYAWAIHKGQEPNYYFIKQLRWAGIGIAAMLFLASPAFDYHIMRNPLITWGFFGLCGVLMFLVLAGLGSTSGGAERWIELGGVSFQPSEFMKLAVIMVFAFMISNNYSKMNTFKGGILNFMAVLIPVAVLTILQPHLSGTIIICTIALAMMFVGGANLKYFIPTCIAGVVGITVVGFYMYKVANYGYIIERIEGWLNTFAPENRDLAWQTRNSLIAIGSGGVFGLGLGNSRQKFLYLPESQNDFVFSIVCEELGFVGAVVVILLFVMLVFRGFSIAENAPDKYGMLLASGLVIQIGVQAFLNIAVVSNAIPNTGISLPFFSYGGTALVLQLVQMGIVLNISRQSIPGKERSDADKAELRAIQNAKDTLNGN